MAVQTLSQPARWQLGERRREAIVGYLFILPTYIGFLVFILGPIFGAAGISLTEFSIIGETEFIGLDNYTRMLSDVRLRTAYGNTVVFTIFAVMFNAGIGLVLAVLLNRRMPALMRNIYRSIYFFPLLVAHTYIATIWRFLYQKDTGVINYYLSFLGVQPIPWLSSAQWVMPAYHPGRVEKHRLRHAGVPGRSAKHSKRIL